MAKEVYIALHQAPGLIARLIRWQTRSEYSHASLVFMNDGEMDCVIEAREGHGVRCLEGLHAKPGELIDVCRVEMTEAQAQEIFEFALAQVGKSYDWTMVARFVTRRQEARSSTGRWFCSELVYAAFLQANINLLRRTEPWEVSPGLLARSPLLKSIIA